MSSQDLESATTESPPDSKTRRYDRQLRLWATTGQAALESARILAISASATSTSILKNLVLPGIGHFTILDHAIVSPEDAGNNFFFDGPNSIGKSRAHEAVRLLSQLNDEAKGNVDTSRLEEILAKNSTYLASFTLIIAHNLETTLLDRLSELLWSNPGYPPLVVVRSAGFIAEFFIQCHEHLIVESHSEASPSLRIDKPFPALLEHALSLDFANMDQIEHSHIPYVVILIRALEDWKKSHNDCPPQSYVEKELFKQYVASMKIKPDEENFDEALAQAYRTWTPTTVPSEIAALFQDPALATLTSASPLFFHLLSALHRFTLQPPYTLPLSPTLPDMKSDTTNYVHLQRLYKYRAGQEKAAFKALVEVPVGDDEVDTFVRNAHGLRILRGTRWGALVADKPTLSNTLATFPKATSIHVALSALAAFLAKRPGVPPTVESLTAAAHTLIGEETLLPEEWDNVIGEIVRAPKADLPNTAAFLGGLVAQETIKMITRQYVPVQGYCVVDLVDTWTGVVMT